MDSHIVRSGQIVVPLIITYFLWKPLPAFYNTLALRFWNLSDGSRVWYRVEYYLRDF